MVHEHSVIDGLMNEVIQRVTANGWTVVRQIRVVLGPYAGLDAAHVKEAFHHLEHHHAAEYPFLQNTELVIVEQAAHVQCPVCGDQAPEEALGEVCPACGQGKLELPESLMGLFLWEITGA